MNIRKSDLILIFSGSSWLDVDKVCSNWASKSNYSTGRAKTR